MRKHTSVMLGLLVLLGAGVVVWAQGPFEQLKPGDLIIHEKVEQLKPGEVIIHEKRPGHVIIEECPARRFASPLQIPGMEPKKLVVKPLPDGRLTVTNDEEIPIDRRSQGVTLFLNKVSH